MLLSRLLRKTVCLLLALFIFVPAGETQAYLSFVLPGSSGEAPRDSGQSSSGLSVQSVPAAQSDQSAAASDSSTQSANVESAADSSGPVGVIASDIAVEPDTTLFTGAAVYNVPIFLRPAGQG